MLKTEVMKNKKTLGLLFSLVMLSGICKAQTIDSQYEVATWQGFRSGAVSFTFDDNTPNQLSVVMPMFDQYGFKMTFFPAVNWSPNWTALQKAALNGHEVGSHTVTHANFSSSTNDQQAAELKNSQDAINAKINAQKCLTIAYPYCAVGNSTICKQYYVAARGCSGQIVSKTPSDFMNISSMVCGSQSSIQRTSDFTNKADAAASSNGWVVFLIHAIDNESGYSPTSSTQLKGTLDYLNQNSSKFWVSTFSNVTRYIKERNNALIKEISTKDSVITLTVTDTLDNTVFNLPLTIRRVLPQEWSSVTATQNGKTIASKIVEVNSKNYVMFDAVPDGGEIQLKKENTTGVPENFDSQIPDIMLLQNYPNPFNPVTTINYQIAKRSNVILKVYDTLGREIATLVKGQLLPGNYSVKFDGTNLSSGLYLYQLVAGNYSSAKKLMLLK